MVKPVARKQTLGFRVAWGPQVLKIRGDTADGARQEFLLTGHEGCGQYGEGAAAVQQPERVSRPRGAWRQFGGKDGGRPHEVRRAARQKAHHACLRAAAGRAWSPRAAGILAAAGS